jgi:hypothetical protein
MLIWCWKDNKNVNAINCDSGVPVLVEVLLL